MSLLSDTIEQFIKDLLGEYEGSVDIQRNELAQHFNCAPSHINYVLATRFNLDKGYIIESHKGGGGYIRVMRLDLDEDDSVLDLITQRIGQAISQRDAFNIIGRLRETGVATPREAELMKAVVSDSTLTVPLAVKDNIRACILKNAIISLIKEEG
jgi:transcriptional regulator CtsR